MLARHRQFRPWSTVFLGTGLVGIGLLALWTMPADAQYLTPNGTEPGSNTIPVAPPLNSSSTLQRKAGSLIVGPNGGTAKLCLNASAADLAAYPATTKCIQTWADIATSVGGPFLKYDPALALSVANRNNPTAYPSDPGFVRIQARCVDGNCIDGNRQLYSFLTDAGTPNLSGTRGLYATDSGDGASYAGYFAGRLHIYQTIGGGDPPGEICLNGSLPEIHCINQWTDITSSTPPSTLFLRLQSTNPPTPDTGSISVSGTGFLGSAVIDAPIPTTLRTATCGDGFCRVQTGTDTTNYETSATCPIDCAPIVQLTGLAVPNLGGQYCSLSHTTACTVSPDTCGVNGPCVTMTGEVRVGTGNGQLPASSQFQVLVIRGKNAPPEFVPLQGSVYTAGLVYNDATILYSGLMNQNQVNQLVARDRVTSTGTYYYRAFVGNLYPRYGIEYTPLVGSDAQVTYHSLTVTRSPVAGGAANSLGLTHPTGSGPDGQIRCGATPNNFCTGYYRAGTQVNIDAQASAGYTHSGWLYCDSVQGTLCTVTVNNLNQIVTAQFTAGASSSLLSLTKSGDSRSSVSSSPSGINCNLSCLSDAHSFTNGTVVTLTLNPDNNDDSTFWGGCDSSTNTTCTVNVSSPRTVTAYAYLSGGGSPPPGGGSCFTGETRVDTPHGSRPIDQLRIGDQVMAYNEATGQTVVSQVTRTYIHPNERYGRLTLSNGTTVQVTSVHRFFDPRSRTWRPIGEMRPGDVLSIGYGAAARQVTILKSEFTSGRGTVYNLEVEKYHNFYIHGVLVHNKKGG